MSIIKEHTHLYDQIETIEKEIRDTPYHKGTEHHIGLLRAKLAKLKDRIHEDVTHRKTSARQGYAIKKQGDATVVLVGPPSVGKSTLLNKLTNAKSKVAPYEFTTVTVIPGMMEYKDARIQILDVPGLIRGAEEGKGRGREVLSVIRGCDLLLIMTDINDLQAFKRIISTLEKNGVHINKNAPNVTFDKKIGGGLVIHSNIKQDISRDTIKEIAQEFSIRNAEITIKEKLTYDRLIDVFSKNRVYIPAVYAINKYDLFRESGSVKIEHNVTYNDISYISVINNIGIDKLREIIWEKLAFLRIYLVKPDEEPSFNNPILMKTGQTLYDVAIKIGNEFAEGKTKAKIWGTHSKYPGQEVSLYTKVDEGIQVRFI